MDGRPREDGREGEAFGPATPESLPLPARGVENGEPGGRDGDESVRDIVGLGRIVGNVPLVLRVGLSAPLLKSRELSCFAVMFMYFAARDPAVILSVRATPFGVFLVVGVLKDPFVGIPMPGVDLPAVEEGVTRPLRKEAEGVLGMDKDGVILPVNAGVDLPPREDATDAGR